MGRRYVAVSVPAQCTRPCGSRIVDPYATVAPGCTEATGLPSSTGWWVQSISTYSIGLSASGPDDLGEALKHQLACVRPAGALRTAATKSRRRTTAAPPPWRRPAVVEDGPYDTVIQTPEPERPLARQNGVAYTASTFISVPIGMCCAAAAGAGREQRGPVDAQHERRRHAPRSPLGLDRAPIADHRHTVDARLL